MKLTECPDKLNFVTANPMPTIINSEEEIGEVIRKIIERIDALSFRVDKLLDSCIEIEDV